LGVLFIFVDGLGWGLPDPAINPLATPGGALSFLGPILGGPAGPPRPGETVTVSFGNKTGLAGAADACLGLPGLPQSATGQTTLLTGINAAAYMGRHASAYPLGKLKRLLEEHSLFARGVRAGRKTTFLNMFRPDGLALLLRGERPASATTAATLGAGLPLRTVEDLLRGEAVYHDITCWTVAKQDYGLSLVSPQEAARRAVTVAAQHDFCLFEYFLTDLGGHSREQAFCLEILGNLDAFIGAVAEALGPETTMVVASDHGNIEDLSCEAHTVNPVPVMAFGREARTIVDGLTAIDELAGRMAALAGIPAVSGAAVNGGANEPAIPSGSGVR
jgi:2,3-bisphosphoglycerate-independent phosphoglycerate mutase